MADFFDSLFKDAKAKELEAKFKSIGLLTIEHKPVDLDTFIFSKDYLGLEMLSPKQARLLIELDNLDPETCKNEFVVVVGKGGGKDLVASIASLRFCYRLAIEGPPADYTGKHLNLPITSLNIAVNAEQANSVYFETFKNIGKNIFKKLDCEVKMGEVVFPNNITAVSGHSFAEGLEGYNLFSATLDEIAAFKGLGQNVPVLTPKGWVNNGEINVGDYVVGSDGKPTQVMGVFPMGRKKTYKVVFEDGADVECSEDHYWTVDEQTDGRRKVRKTIQLKDFKSLVLKGKYNQKRYSIPIVNPVEFQPIGTLPIDSYLLGVLIGDGCLGSSRMVRFSSTDEFIINEVRKLVDISYLGRCDYYIHSGGSTAIGASLKNLGLWGKKSNNKFIPKIYKYASVENRKALLAGLMDTDGTPARGSGSYTTVSETLKDDIIELCRGLGGVPMASKHKSWYVDKNGNKIPCQEKWMICPRVPFNPFFIPRKAEKWKLHKRSLNRSVVGVFPTGKEEDITCIKVENEDGLYVVKDYIVTHNTESELKGKSIRSKQSAKFIYDMAKSSIKSRFPKTGKLILISYPRFEGDFILQKYQEGLSNPKVYTEFATTWEFNPYAKEEDFDSEKERDFKEYCSKYLCVPPKAKDAYFSEEDRVRAIVNPKLPNPWAISPLERLENSFFGKGHTYFLGLDLSLKHDRSGLALCHRETKDNREQKVVIDLLKVWEAPVNGEINFEDIRKFIFMLVDRRFRIEMVLLDSFQSADFRQILSKNQIPTETRYSCDKGKQVYDTLKDLINQGKIECVDCKYTKLLIDELLGLSLITNTKIDHTDAGSKDLADSTALAVFASAMSDVSAPAWVKNW